MFVTTLAQIANRSYDYNGRDNVYYAPMQYKRFRYFRQYEYSPRTIRGLLEYKPIIARPPFYFLLSVLNGFSSLYIPPSLSRFIPPFFSSITAPFAFFRHLQKCWGANRSRARPEFEGVGRISVPFLPDLCDHFAACAKAKTLPILFSRRTMVNLFSPNCEGEIII